MKLEKILIISLAILFLAVGVNAAVYEGSLEVTTGDGNIIIGNGGCQEQWSCFWTECIDNSQTYVCTDTNNCGTNNLEPALSGTTRECGIITPPGGGGGGGGFSGGGGSSGNGKTTAEGNALEVDGSCEENWICYAWSNVEGKCGERECFDRNRCETIDLKPLTEKECGVVVNSVSRFTSAVTGVTERVLTTPGIYIPLIFVFLVAAGGLTVILLGGRKK